MLPGILLLLSFWIKTPTPDSLVILLLKTSKLNENELNNTPAPDTVEMLLFLMVMFEPRG